MQILKAFAIGALATLLASCQAADATQEVRNADEISIADACADGMITWRIDHFDERGSTRVEAIGLDWYIGSGVRYTDVPYLMRRFDVTSPADMVGKEFSAECALREDGEYGYADPHDALDMIAMEELHGGRYVPPTDEELHQRVVLALLYRSEPNFMDVDENTVYEAFSRLYFGDAENRTMRADPLWMARLARDVSRMSDGRITLVQADREDFTNPSRCMCDEYLAIENTFDQPTVRVMIGPYKTPVRIDS